MLHVHHSNRLERLADALAAVLARSPPPPLAAETVVVPDTGTARWLKLRLADTLGACINLRFPFPAAFAWETFRVVLPEIPVTSAYAPEVLRWRLFDLLDRIDERPAFAPLRRYLSGGEERRRYELASRVAAVFDQYLLFRPDWIRQWEAGEGEHWQAILWRCLAGASGAHWVRLHDAFLTAAAGASPAPLPKRVAVFGVPALTPAYLEVLEVLSRRIEVHLFLVNPCREYWGDIVSRRTLPRLTARQSAEDLHLAVGNGLLAACGRMARDFIDRAIELGGETSEDFDAPAGDTLLTRIQADVLDLREAGEQGAPRQIAPCDVSLQVHACHSPMREVEVLHDRLLALFEGDATLTPADVLVMTPDLPRYAPLIEAVFATAEPPIPFQMAAGGDALDHPCAETFFALLALPQGRFAAEEVLRPLATPAVRRRFNLDEEDIEQARGWIRDTGIRWGRDAEERGRLGFPAGAGNTWRAGLDRLLLGFALPGGDARLYHGILPCDEVEGSGARTLGALLDYLEALAGARERLARSRMAAEWGQELRALLAAFFEPAEGDEPVVQSLRAAIAEVGVRAQVAGYGGGCDPVGVSLECGSSRLRPGSTSNAAAAPLPEGAASRPRVRGAVGVEVIAAELRDSLTAQGQGGPPLRGGVSIGDLGAAGLPFRVVCLLGLDDGVVPARDRRADFDLMGGEWRRGDRSAREEDRYRFLRAILSAREVLYLSYCGQDVRDNSPRPASVLVEELLDYVDRGHLAADGQPARTQLIVRHPLQAFSARYFSGDAKLFSYARTLCAARAAAGNRERGPLLTVSLPEPEGDWREVELTQLLRFFRNPARFFAQQRLGVWLEEEDPAIEDTEPFGFIDFADRGLRERLAERFRQGAGEADMREIERARGGLPHGAVGEVLFEREARAVRAQLRKLAARQAGAPLPPLPIDLRLGDWRLSGRLEGLQGGGLLDLQVHDQTPAALLGLWIRHLVLNCLRPAEAGARSEGLWLDRRTVFASCERPGELLTELLDCYGRGWLRPLPFFPRSADAYMRALDKGEAQALGRARGAWQGGSRHRGEGEDPYYRLMFGETDPLDVEFARCAQAILGPLIEHQERSR